MLVGKRGNAALFTEFPQHIIISLKYGEVLSVNKTADGAIFLPLILRDQDGKVIVAFDADGFSVNRNNILKMERKDRSSLVILDQYGTEVINARYINQRTFQLSGLLSYGTKRIPIEFPGLGSVCTANAASIGADVEIP